MLLTAFQFVMFTVNFVVFRITILVFTCGFKNNNCASYNTLVNCMSRTLHRVDFLDRILCLC